MQTNFNNYYFYKYFVKEKGRMFKVIFGVGVAIMLQIVGTAVVKDVQIAKFSNVENFNMEKMLGPWYAVRTNYEVGPNPCYLMEFYKDQSNKFSMDICGTYEAVFVCLNATNLRITDRISVYNDNDTLSDDDASFSIPATDYDNYAVIQVYDKSDTSFIVILSRNKVLDVGQLDKLTTKYIGTTLSSTHVNDDCPAINATRPRLCKPCNNVESKMPFFYTKNYYFYFVSFHVKHQMGLFGTTIGKTR